MTIRCGIRKVLRTMNCKDSQARHDSQEDIFFWHANTHIHSGGLRDGQEVPGPGKAVWLRISYTFTLELSSLLIN